VHGGRKEWERGSGHVLKGSERERSWEIDDVGRKDYRKGDLGCDMT